MYPCQIFLMQLEKQGYSILLLSLKDGLEMKTLITLLLLINLNRDMKFKSSEVNQTDFKLSF